MICHPDVKRFVGVCVCVQKESVRHRASGTATLNKSEYKSIHMHALLLLLLLRRNCADQTIVAWLIGVRLWSEPTEPTAYAF